MADMQQAHEHPEVYDDDVVCLQSDPEGARIYGIVLETAWGNEQEEEEQGEETDDDEEGEDDEDDEEEQPKGKGAKQQDDEEEDEDDDDDEDEDEDRLGAGCVRVAWPNRVEEELAASDLLVVDRSFLHGDVVVSRTDKQGQIGTVVDVQLELDVHFDAVNGGAHAVTLSRLPAQSLLPPHPFIVGRYVTRGGMLGLVQDCSLEIDVAFGATPFAPAGVCTVRKPAPSLIKPRLASKEEVHEDEVGHGVYYPGMRVKAKHNHWKAAKWVTGSHVVATASNDEGVVIAVRPLELEVDWISGDDPVLMRGGRPTLRPDECTLLGLWEETRWQVGDHVGLTPAAYQEHAERIRAEEAAKEPAGSSSSAAAAGASAAAADSSAAAPAASAAGAGGKPAKGKKGKAAAAPPAPRDLAHLFAFCGTIVRTYTSVRVQWQDGSTTPFMSALELVSRDHLLEDDFMVHDFAVMSGEEQRLVHVLAVNARERMVHVRYLSPMLRQTEVGPWAEQRFQVGAGMEQHLQPPQRQLPSRLAANDVDPVDGDASAESVPEGHEAWVPVFDLRTNPAFEYTLGGVVLRVPGGRDDRSSSALPPDSKMGHAGQVLRIENGLITVLWADHTESTLEADQLLIVEHDEDNEGDEEEEEGEDEDEEEEEEEEADAEEQQQDAAPPASSDAVPADAAEDDDDDEDDDEGDDDIDSAAPGSIPNEWTSPDFWKKTTGAQQQSHTDTEGASSSAAATSASSGVDAATSALASLSVSASAAARPGYSYSSFAIIEADEADEPSADAASAAASSSESAAATRSTPLQAHKWASTPFAAGGGKAGQKAFTKRVRDECRQLASSLPAGVHVRGYESRMDLFSVCIFGAVGTPYYLSVFTFDMALPGDYPNSPPTMHFHSRGHRLNPNLYLDGNICLSLLNTWKASHASQRWDPAHSTLLQLLVSLQGLVIGSTEPYYLEAGYERQMGQKQACLNSHLYNETALLTSLSHLATYAAGAAPAASAQQQQLGAAPFDNEVGEHVRSEEVQQRTRELQRIASQWEAQKRREMSHFGTSVEATPAAESASDSADASVDEETLAAVLARFAIRADEEVSPAPTAAGAPPAATAVSVHYHPSLAFVTMLGRQMRTLIAAMDRVQTHEAGAATTRQ